MFQRISLGVYLSVEAAILEIFLRDRDSSTALDNRSSRLNDGEGEEKADGNE